MLLCAFYCLSAVIRSGFYDTRAETFRSLQSLGTMAQHHAHAATVASVLAATHNNKGARPRAKQASDKCPALRQRGRLLARSAQQQSEIASRSHWEMVTEGFLRAAVMSTETECHYKRSRIASMPDDLASCQQRHSRLSKEIASAAGTVRCVCICTVGIAILFGYSVAS